MIDHRRYRTIKQIQFDSSAHYVYFCRNRRGRVVYEGEMILIPKRRVLKDINYHEIMAHGRGNSSPKEPSLLTRIIKWIKKLST